MILQAMTFLLETWRKPGGG